MPSVEQVKARFFDATRETDLFRALILGFGLLEDLFDLRIGEMLAEPLDGLDSAPFRQKLNLAIGLGLIHPERRSGFTALARLRNTIAHAEKDPADIHVAEAKRVCRQIDPDGEIDSLAQGGEPTTVEEWLKLALAAAYIELEVGAKVASEVRQRERDALLKEMASHALSQDVIRGLLAKHRDVDERMTQE
jgi:hypothetical protein